MQDELFPHLENVPFGSQVGADPRDHPRWSEEEGRILSYDELEERPHFESDDTDPAHEQEEDA